MTTLKKLIGLILVVTIFASTAVMLSSCKKEEHTHTFYGAWMTDAENHWHAASCGHAEEKGDLGAHSDKNYDNLCDVCGFDISSVNSNPINLSTYVVYVKDSSGQPVENVKVWLIGGESYTTYKITDSRGRVSFTLEEGAWVAALAEIPEGAGNTLDETYSFDGNNDAAITLR